MLLLPCCVHLNIFVYSTIVAIIISPFNLLRLKLYLIGIMNICLRIAKTLIMVNLGSCMRYRGRALLCVRRLTKPFMDGMLAVHTSQNYFCWYFSPNFYASVKREQTHFKF